MKRSLAFFTAGVIGVGLIAAVATWQQALNQLPKQPAVRNNLAARGPVSAVITEEKRKVYPYSIVPGGAQTLAEAKRAMSDPAVRINYAGIDLNKLKQVVLTADLSGYVSYRYGDRVYWTSKVLHLKAGETIFTDGQHIVRGRCLNCYSANPMLPTRAQEPAEKVLDTPMEVPAVALTFPTLPLPAAPVLPPPSAELAAVTSGSAAPGHHGGKFFPIIPIIPIIPTHKHHPQPPPPPPPPPTPVSVVPEPRFTWIAPGAVLLLAFCARAWKRRGKFRLSSPI